MNISKGLRLLKGDSFSHHKKISEEHLQRNFSMFELKNIFENLINNLQESIAINDPVSIFENLQNFTKFIKMHKFVQEPPSAFLLDILNLLSYPNSDIQKLNSDLIPELISIDNSIGIFFIDNNIIEIIQEEISKQEDLLIYFFPIIRILTFLENDIFQKIIDTIPFSFFEICFESQELNEEMCLFLNIISSFEQDEYVQNFILQNIRKVYDLGISHQLSNCKKCFIYLACSLHQLSRSSVFYFDLFQSLNLNEFVDFSLKETEYHCILPICLFLSNLFQNNFITSLSKHNLDLIIHYSMKFDRPKRCEASIDLLINTLKFGDIINTLYLLEVCPIGIKLLKLFFNEDLNFSIKYKITSFLLEFASKASFEIFTQLIAFRFFEIINFILSFSEDDLIDKMKKLIENSYPLFESANTTDFFIDALKKCIDFDSIQLDQIEMNESLNSFLSLLHEIIDDDEFLSFVG